MRRLDQVTASRLNGVIVTKYTMIEVRKFTLGIVDSPPYRGFS